MGEAWNKNKPYWFSTKSKSDNLACGQRVKGFNKMEFSPQGD